MRSLVTLNEALNLKLCWDILNFHEDWAFFLEARGLQNRVPCKYHFQSSIWCRIKRDLYVVVQNSSSLIGNGLSINFLLDRWCGPPLVINIDVSN